MSSKLELPTILDLIAAPGLLEAFTIRRGGALNMDAGAVQRLGAQCLQVLLAGRAAWAADDQHLTLENPSDEFIAALELLGAAPDDLTHDAQRDGPKPENKELAA